MLLLLDWADLSRRPPPPTPHPRTSAWVGMGLQYPPGSVSNAQSTAPVHTATHRWPRSSGEQEAAGQGGGALSGLLLAAGGVTLRFAVLAAQPGLAQIGSFEATSSSHYGHTLSLRLVIDEQCRVWDISIVRACVRACLGGGG